MQKRRKSVSEEQQHQIKILSEEGKTDVEIAAEVHLGHKLVQRIRIHTLNISHNQQVRECEHCHKEKNVKVFNRKVIGYENWCIVCRRKAGITPPMNYPNRRNSRIKSYAGVVEKRIECLSCGKKFTTHVYPGGKYQYYTCKRCRKANEELERTSFV